MVHQAFSRPAFKVEGLVSAATSDPAALRSSESRLFQMDSNRRPLAVDADPAVAEVPAVLAARTVVIKKAETHVTAAVVNYSVALKQVSQESEDRPDFSLQVSNHRA